MANEHLTNKLISLQVRGNYGYPWGCGEYRCGFNLLGEENEFSGTYQRVYGQHGAYFKRAAYTREYISATAPQLAKRSAFATGVAGWNALTSGAKLQWKEAGKKRQMTGLNLYMQRYVKGRPLTP